MTTATLTTAERTTVASAAQILADQQAALLSSVAPVWTPYVQLYYPTGLAYVDVTWSNPAPAKHDIYWLMNTSADPDTGSNIETGSSADGPSYTVVIPAGETSTTVRIPLVTVPDATKKLRLGYTDYGPYQYRPQIGGYNEFVYFETNRPTTPALPNTYKKVLSIDPATTFYGPNGAGVVTGGADVYDNITPGFASGDFERFTYNNTNQVFNHPLHNTGDFQFATSGWNQTPQSHPIISGKRYFRVEYLPSAVTPPNTPGWTTRWSGAEGYSWPYFHTRYGYFEAKVKLPDYNVAGNWNAAFWSVGSMGWAAMEIDVAERNQDSTAAARAVGLQNFQMNIHAALPNASAYSDSAINNNCRPRTLAEAYSAASALSTFDPDDFNIYGLWWTRDWLKFYINGVLVQTITNEDDRWNSMQQWVVGWSQATTAGTTTDFTYGLSAGVNNSKAEMSVEYFRVWQDVVTPSWTDEGLDRHFRWINAAVSANVDSYTWTTGDTLPPGFVTSNTDTTVAPSVALLKKIYASSNNPVFNNANFIIRTKGATGPTSGKKYARILLSGNSAKTVGLVTSGHGCIQQQMSGSTTMPAPHVYTALEYKADGTIWFDGAQLYSGLSTYGTTDYIEIWVDRTNGRFWVAVNGGNKNNNASADVTAGATGPNYGYGLAIPVKMVGPLMVGVQFKYAAVTTEGNSATLQSASLASGYSNF